jgi:hypothetical protein
MLKYRMFYLKYLWIETFIQQYQSVNRYQLQSYHFKGIVSRDWGRLQMGSLDRSEFCTIPLEVYFQFKIHFKLVQNGVRPSLKYSKLIYGLNRSHLSRIKSWCGSAIPLYCKVYVRMIICLYSGLNWRNLSHASTVKSTLPGTSNYSNEIRHALYAR